MKLHYLSSEAIVRLFDFNFYEAEQLHAALHSLADQRIERVDVHKLPFVTSIAECRLIFLRKVWDQSLVLLEKPASFECGLKAETWQNIAGLIEPFTNETAQGFQWLAGCPGAASLLFSVDGSW